MPTARKKAAGKGKKEVKVKEEVEKLSELDKEMYLIQIKDLEEKVARCQTKCSELVMKNQSCKSELDQVTSDKKDIVAFLKQTLDQRADDIAELQERLDGLNKARESDNRLHEEQVAQLKLQYQEMKDQLTSENIVLTGKLTSLEEFKSRREEIMVKIDSLQTRLKENEVQHRETVRSMEKSNILDKDKLKRDMRQKVEELAASFRQISNKQMSETTRRAIQENTRLGEQLDKMLEKLSATIVDNQNLNALKSEQQLRISVMESVEKDLLKKNNGLSRVSKEQSVKLQEQVETIKELNMYHLKSNELEEQMKTLQKELEQWKKEAEIKNRTNERLGNRILEHTEKYHTLQADHSQLKSVLLDAAGALQQGITMQFEPEEDDTGQRQSIKDDVLSHVLEILNTAQFLTTEIDKPTITTRGPVSAAMVRFDNRTRNEQEEDDQYDVGDIGLVPCLSKSAPASAKRNKISMHTVAIQTDAIYTPHLPAMLPGTCRSIRSAACRILHDVNCYPKTFTPEVMQKPK